MPGLNWLLRWITWQTTISSSSAIPSGGGDTPMAVLTFLENYDFSGKTLIPFCTSGSSSPQTSYRTIENTLPDAEIRDGFWTPGAQAADARDDIA